MLIPFYAMPLIKYRLQNGCNPRFSFWAHLFCNIRREILYQHFLR